MTPRRWTLVTTADYPGGIVADGPQIQPGEQPLVVEAPVSPPDPEKEIVVPFTWDGLVGAVEAILDTYYPDAVFTGESGDKGAVFVAVLHDARRALRGEKSCPDCLGRGGFEDAGFGRCPTCGKELVRGSVPAGEEHDAV